jgi:glycerol kinase
MSANNWMAQDLADMLGITVERPGFVETTALGSAMLAATGAGLYPSLDAAAQAMRGELAKFTPQLAAGVREERLTRWRKALSAA